MASLSLPRVLHPKKTSLDIVRENIEKAQSQALQKAINYQECPVKQKHVRSAIIGTFQTQGGKIFWNYALRLPYLDDRIVAWKLCHVVHKILREGHPLCLVHSQRHRSDLEQMGNLWGHLHEGYGKMIKLYTALLINKLEFHRRNPRFPGHLGVSPEELESIGGNDVNNYFDITIEMFDYLDKILALQKEVLGSLSMSYASSMTSTGQCRLAPLIPCIQDASKLYDYCVKILFKLHSTLPPDTLHGHRTRFLQLFCELKDFYERSSNLQYFKDLIAIPPLPEKPVNFLIKSDFGTYITQEVIVPEEKEDPIHEETLIDTTDGTTSNNHHHFEPPMTTTMHVSTAAYENIVQEKDFLKTQCDNLRGEINALMMKNQREIVKFQSKISTLEHELSSNRESLEKERNLKEELLNQSVLVAQSQDAEQKHKFEKLKNVYVKLRDEHLTTLRKIPDLEKKLVTAVKEVEKMQELKEEKEQLEATKAEITEELQALQKDKELFHMETEILKKSIDDACKERDSIQNNFKIASEDKETFKKRADELSDKIMELEQQYINEKDNCKLELETLVNNSINNSKEILAHAIHEIDNPAITALTCSSDYFRALTKGCEDLLESCVTVSYENHSDLIALAGNIAHRITIYILQGRATCNTSPDITFGEKMADECKLFGHIVLKLLENLKGKQPNKEIVEEALKKLHEINALAENISLSILGEKAGHLADMLENEMVAMDKAIEEAANRIQDMLTKSRAADSGIKLEVNEKILDSCTTLMQAIRTLVKKSRLLQAEIVAQGKGTASAKEFYKRNHQWTDGFISAAKAVGVAAQFLLTAADKVVTKSNGKLEHLVVAAQEIGASTAQLVVASRVKADRHSDNLKQLTQASKGVTTATGAVVATVKDCGQLIEETEELDVSNLTLHQAKRLEIEAQVRVLELEKELEQERYRLAKLRRHHYQLAGDDDGNNAT